MNTEPITPEIVSRLRKYLGETGLCHLAGIKARHGRIDAYWLIDGDTGMKYCVNDHEGYTVREILRSFEECREWTSDDFMNNWLAVCEKALAPECGHQVVQHGRCVECREPQGVR